MRQKFEISTLVAVLILAVISPVLLVAQAAPAVSLEEQLKAQFQMVKMGGDSNGPAVLEPGTLLAIQKGGILGVPYGNMNLLPAKYQDGTLHPPVTATSNSATAVGQKMCGLFGKCSGVKDQVGKQTTTRLFQVGEKVYPSKIEVNPTKDTVALSVISCDSCNKIDPPTYYKSEVIFQFAKGSLAKASVPQVEDTIAQVFSMDTGDDAQNQGGQQGGGQQGGGQQGGGQQGGGGQGHGQQAQQQQPEPETIQLGQTTDQVQGALGKPEKVVNLGPKMIYVYKDLKVTFVNGKVSDVQ
jgi:uncharacterized membrane protein YgcG